MNPFLLFVLVTGGSLVSSLTGLGGGTLILAGMLLFFPAEVAIPLHSFTQLSSNALRSGLFFREIDWKVVMAYAALMLPAAFLGAHLFDLFNPHWLKIVVGTFILISLIPFSFAPKGEPRLRTFLFLGSFSGFLGIFVGAVGPMVTTFFNRLKLTRQGMLSTKSAGQALLQISKIFAFWGATTIDFSQFKDSIFILILGTLVGVGISIPISRRISDQKFDLIVNIMLAVISLKVIYEGIAALISA
jgi:uncharacterized protein